MHWRAVGKRGVDVAVDEVVGGRCANRRVDVPELVHEAPPRIRRRQADVRHQLVVDADRDLVRARRAIVRIDLVHRQRRIRRDDVARSEEPSELARIDLEVVVPVDGEVVRVRVARRGDVARDGGVELSGERRVARAADRPAARANRVGDADARRPRIPDHRVLHGGRVDRRQILRHDRVRVKVNRIGRRRRAIEPQRRVDREPVHGDRVTGEERRVQRVVHLMERTDGDRLREVRVRIELHVLEVAAVPDRRVVGVPPGRHAELDFVAPVEPAAVAVHHDLRPVGVLVQIGVVEDAVRVDEDLFVESALRRQRERTIDVCATRRQKQRIRRHVSQFGLVHLRRAVLNPRGLRRIVGAAAVLLLVAAEEREGPADRLRECGRRFGADVLERGLVRIAVERLDVDVRPREGSPPPQPVLQDRAAQLAAISTNAAERIS